MINIIKENFNRALYALIFSIITIGTLSFLEFETPYGLFLAGSFGSSMVLLFGYPESPFAQPKNVFFGHLVTSIVGVLILKFLPVDQFLQIAIAGRPRYFCNDNTWCNSSTSRRKSHCYNSWCLFL